MNKDYDVIIIGGGAAGLMAASVCGKRGKKTLLLEANKNLGKKILISGGGRCNFTNLFASNDNFLSQNPHFFKSALKRYSPYEFLDLVESYNIEYVEKAQGQLFCKNTARDIVNMLESECKKYEVEILLNCAAKNIQKVGEFFSISTSDGDYQSKSLIVATGGLPISQIGGNDFGLKLAKNFGMSTTSVEPALVPYKLSESLLKKTMQNLWLIN